MKPLQKAHANVFIPSQETLEVALQKTTHMAIGAHQDDLEIMAYHGIVSCFQQKDKSFTGIVVTDGAGSARSNEYQSYSDEMMKEVRILEQNKAAMLGEYGAMIQLGYPSKETKDPHNHLLVEELTMLLTVAKPQILYTHNLADKHDTHIGVVTKVIHAIRSLEPSNRPQQVWGCEVWRDLDWLSDQAKVLLPTDQHPNLAAALVEVFDSQIVGGKRYDLACIGRRLANATYFESHAVDTAKSMTFAMDLTPLIIDDTLDITQFVLNHINAFKQDVQRRVQSMLP